MIANYIKILTKPQWELFQYHINFIPDVENKRFRREMIAQHRVSISQKFLILLAKDLLLIRFRPC